MSTPESTDIVVGDSKQAMTGAQRQAALRQKRLDAGQRQYNFWLTEREHAKVKSLLAGTLQSDLESLSHERDKLDAQLRKSRLRADDLREELHEKTNEIIDHLRTISELGLKLQQAENALKQKPPRTSFKVPELPDRRTVIASAMTDNWDKKERSTDRLKAQADLARKFSAEIKNARSRLVGLVEVAAGAKLLEQSKSRSVFGGYIKFAAPIISEAEKSLLQEAGSVMRKIEHDVERAGHDVGVLHEQRVAEEKARFKQAADTLDKLLFSGLDRRGEVLFLASMHMTSPGYGAWSDLLDAVKDGKPRWGETAMGLFKRAMNEEKASLAQRIADTMKDTGKSAEELVGGVVEKYRHLDTEEKYGEKANQVTMFLVADRISGQG